VSEAHAEPSTPVGKPDDASKEKRNEASNGPVVGSAERAVVPPAAGSAKGAVQPKGEHGGPKGPEPTRYGDWEKGGRCFDF
jgi:hypothetical protein